MVTRGTDKHFGGIAAYDLEGEDWSSYIELIFKAK